MVKVEHPGRGDDTRHWGPPWTASSSSYFAAANRSKLSLGLDLSVLADAELGRCLADRADVLVENFRTGVLGQWALDPASVLASNPRLIYCSITGFGSGRGAALPGYDFVVQALGGLMSITGSPEGEPTKAGVALVDVLTAKDAMIGILAALRTREQDGRGQHVEVNLLSSLLGSLANQASGFLASGSDPIRMGNQHPSIAPYETLRCGTGLVAIACGNDGQFGRLCDVLGVPEAAIDPLFSTNSARIAHRSELVALLEELSTSRPADQWETILVAAGVPAGQVGTIASGFARAEELGLDPLVSMPTPHPPQVAHPIRYSRTPLRSPAPPPDLAADDRAVREWILDERSLGELDDLLLQRKDD